MTLLSEEVRRFCGSRRDQEEGGELDSQLLLNSNATDIVLVTLLSTVVERAIAKYTICYAMVRGHCLNIWVVLAAVHDLLGLQGQCARSSLHSFAPFPPFLPPPLPPPPPPPPPIPVPNKPTRLCGPKAKCLLRLTKQYVGALQADDTFRCCCCCCCCCCSRAHHFFVIYSDIVHPSLTIN